MKTLETIQTLAKIGKVLSNIVFVCCIVAACLCIIGIVALALGLESVKIGGTTINSLLINIESMSKAALYTTMGAGIVFSIAEAVLAKFAELYFKHELVDGDPFTLRGSKELLRLGILTIAIPLGTIILCSIGINVVDNFFPGVDNLFSGEYSQVGLGAMMLILSLLCRYGAEGKGAVD